MFVTDWLKASGGVVGFSFLVGVPAAIGFLSVSIGRWCGSDRWVRDGMVIPWIVIAVGCVASVVTGMEAILCVLIAAPVFSLATIFGAAVAHQLLPRNGSGLFQVTVAAFFPFLLALPESFWHWPDEVRTREDVIEISAPAEVVWKEIASVRPIAREELPDSWIYTVNFPRPIAATLDREGVGGIRTATFERGVSFFEAVTEWEPPRALAFTIKADPEFIPHTAFDQHIVVGGRFFDVLDGRYEIEPLPSGRCRLHLSSRHRLSTRFNGYAGWWSGLIMGEIQGTILEVIRHRSERAVAR